VKRRSTVPENFEVTARIIELAKQNGWPNPHEQLDAFKDYHLAHGTLMADWEAAFRTWLRNSLKFGKTPIVKPVTGKSPILNVKGEQPHDPKVADLLNGLVKQFDVRKKA